MSAWLRRARLAASTLRRWALRTVLFSVLPVSKDQVKQLREDHGIYMAGSGRINVAGLTMDNIDKFIAALADVTG